MSGLASWQQDLKSGIGGGISGFMAGGPYGALAGAAGGVTLANVNSELSNPAGSLSNPGTGTLTDAQKLALIQQQKTAAAFNGTTPGTPVAPLPYTGAHAAKGLAVGIDPVSHQPLFADPNGGPPKTAEKAHFDFVQKNAADAAAAAGHFGTQAPQIAPGTGTIDTGPQDASRRMQMNLAGSLQNTINNPNAPSVAQQQLQASTQANDARIAGAAAQGAVGNNVALALRQRLESQGANDQAAGGQAALARAQEVATAQGQLGNVSGQIRTSDQLIADAQAKNNILAATTNVNSANTNKGLDVTAQGNALTAGNQATANNDALAIGLQGAKQHASDSNRQLVNGLLTTGAQLYSTSLKAPGTGAGGAVAPGATAGAGYTATTPNDPTPTYTSAPGADMSDAALSSDAYVESDKRVKKSVKPGGHALAEMLSKIKPAAFSYKEGAGDGADHVGVMAQDLEKSKAGRTLVSRGNDGIKRVNTSHASMANMAALAEMHKRVSKLEASRAR